METNKFIEYIKQEHGIEDFMEWISIWIEAVEWDFPALLDSMPASILDQFKEEGVYYRGMVTGGDYVPVSAGACSWTSDRVKAEVFSEQSAYADNILDEGETPVGIIYEFKGKAINLNKIKDTLMYYVEESNIDFDQLESIKHIYKAYEGENEFIANFDLNEVKEIYRYKC